MKHGSLFSGIGGFDLASQWMGWENVFQCEVDKFNNKLLNYYWPKSIKHENIYSTDFTVYRGNVDILTGGFPCKSFSQSGKRTGSVDSTYIWPEMLRAIREIMPRWFLAENVYGFISWNGGMVFEKMCIDLENEGFEIISLVLPAASVNAPHKRDRLFVLGRKKDEEGVSSKNPISDGFLFGEIEKEGTKIWEQRNLGARTSNGIHISKGDFTSINDTRFESNGFNEFPTQSAICCGDDGISDKLDGITFSEWREESLKGYGNAVVPQVILQLFRAIEKYEMMFYNQTTGLK